MNSSIRDQFCPNFNCHYYQKTLGGNVVSHGRGYQRFKCKACGITWVGHRNETRYKLRSSREKIEKALNLICQGFSVRKVAAIIDVTPGTISRWKKKFIS